MKKGLSTTLDTRGIEVETYTSFDTYTFLRERFPTSPSPPEAAVLERVDQKYQELETQFFSEALCAIKTFYHAIEDEEGNRVYSRLTGQDCEQALWAINNCLLTSTSEISRLFTEVQFAWTNFDNVYQELYLRPVSGTQGDRTASATKNSKEQRYYHQYLYYLWKRLSDKQESIRSFKRDLEQYLSRRVYDKNRVYD